MASMTWKERYLAAARHQPVDILPVSPETFYYIPAQVSGHTCQEVAPVGLTLAFHKLKTWEAQLECARHFDFCGWVMPAVGSINGKIESETRITPRADGSIDVLLTHHTPSGDVDESFWFPVNDASWHTHHPVKDAQRDWKPYLELFFSETLRLDLSEAQEASTRTGGQGIVSLYVGGPFTDWLNEAREGGYETVIYELMDNPGFFEPLQERYIAYIREKTRLLCETAPFDELFMGNSYSELPLLSPRLWRQWDYPVLKAFSEVASRYGKITHWHQHGSTAAILPDFADSGLNILCPLECPPGGDADMGTVKHLYGDRLCLKGNVETSLLLNGSPEQVRQAVRQRVEAAKTGSGFILGTGDQVAYDTPFENIRAFVAAGIEFGQY
jgi:hypothetical protein